MNQVEFTVICFGRILCFLFPQSRALSCLEESRVENYDRQHLVFSVHEDYSCQVLESYLPENSDNLTIDSQPLDWSNPKNSDDHFYICQP